MAGAYRQRALDVSSDCLLVDGGITKEVFQLDLHILTHLSSIRGVEENNNVGRKKGSGWYLHMLTNNDEVQRGGP